MKRLLQTGWIGFWLGLAWAADPPIPPTNLPPANLPPSLPPIPVLMPQKVLGDTVRDLRDTTLSPEQVNEIKRLLTERDRLLNSNYVKPSRPITRSLNVNLQSGAQPPMLRLALGTVTSVVFTDAQGNPWFIESVALNRTQFSDGEGGAKASQTNVLNLEPRTTSAFGNVTVMLRGMATPVIFMLSAGQAETDVRVDARIPGRNPDSPGDLVMVTMPQHDVQMVAFIDGVPPDTARRLNVQGGSAEAWLYAGNLFVRTRSAVQSPAFISRMGSSDGTSVYKFAGMPPVVVALESGRAVTYFMSGY